MFDAIIEQDKAVARLLSMFVNDVIPHALLFTGIEGIGKRTIAKAFAMALNCPESIQNKDSRGKEPRSVFPCKVCRSCQKIINGVHPDILQVKSAGTLIKIAQIRELCSKLLIKPYEARTRVVIIQDAHTMNAESSNALLKSLEEPPGNTIFILISNRPSDLLPTILSRCQQVTFNPLSQTGIEQLLLDRNVERPQAAVLSAMVDGSAGKALVLSEQSTRTEQMTALRAWILDEIESLSSATATSCLLFAEKLAAKKDIALEALDFMLSAVRDLIICKFTPEKIQNKDLEKALIRTGQKYSVPKLLSMSAHIQKAQKDIQSNVSLRLCLDVMIFNLLRA
jgi:DNA polymerase III subunit delta'